eukprot:6182216-Pleurochrysis_carterae.AAC.1
MGSALDEFSHAVICSFDQAADPQLRSGATSSLEALKHSADAWQFCLQVASGRAYACECCEPGVLDCCA